MWSVGPGFCAPVPRDFAASPGQTSRPQARAALRRSSAEAEPSVNTSAGRRAVRPKNTWPSTVGTPAASAASRTGEMPPRESPQPMRESYLLTGPLESTNRPYALAKIAGIEMCSAYNRQHPFFCNPWWRKNAPEMARWHACIAATAPMPR